ncbi:MAG: NACHT domain-containing NTPase [Symploca sp. SIO2D2]|nr:NACHT domain-containing NTPase [Symploca sp. SIO2D2]
MQPLPRNFLTKLAREYDLSPEQEDAFVARFSSKENDVSVAESLHISDNAFRTRMSGVYKKFSIGGQAPGKVRRLHDFLLEKYQQSHPVPAPDIDNLDINTLVQEVRQKITPSIHKQCGTMKVLDMTQPIGLKDIYTNVNILEKIIGRRRFTLNELLQSFDLNSEEFDRCGLGKIQEERVSGLEAVQLYDKLLVLGKPGAGKTTFLKYLAIQCANSQVLGEQVPLFITLKQFAETENQPALTTYINQLFTDCGVTEAQTRDILNQGKGLILLDGLDEVREEDSDRILNQIQQFTEQYHTNSFVLTCRIAAKEYTFEKFTEVEVADFDDQQIETFVSKWFQAKESDLADYFMEQLEGTKPIKELATNPLLLTLLCIEFEDSGAFPPNRSELYSRAIHTLLRKWDDKRRIVRQQVYKKLSVQRKEDLLSEVAFTTFKGGEYFFKQRDVEQYIAGYIRNLPDAKTDPEALLLDSEAVLKSIEAQHGLLVERARSIYSFSHLTFQEYFTAREIFVTANLEELANRVTEKHWREVFLLTAGMVRDASKLMQLIKQKIDGLVASDEKIQQFLSWVNQKSNSVNFPYKPVAVRAFYFSLSFGRDRDFYLSFGRSIELDLNFYLSFDLPFDLYLNFYLERAFDLNLDISLNLNLDLDFYLDLDLDLDLDPELDQVLSQAETLTPNLKHSLQQLQDELPNPEEEEEQLQFQQWWKVNGEDWTKQLRAVMIEHRNIGHDWQFNEQQQELLKQYYDANQLLVDCLNSDCYVSQEVRQEIEDTLLLPFK